MVSVALLYAVNIYVDDRKLSNQYVTGDNMATALEIVNQFSQTQDTSLLADDFKFIGPLDQADGKEAFIELNNGFVPMIQDVRMLQQFDNGNSVCSIYEMDINVPTGKTITTAVADWVVVENGKLQVQRIYYDAREFVSEMQQKA